MVKPQKRGFYPPRTFETDIRSYIAAMRENAGKDKAWGEIPGNGTAEVARIEHLVGAFAPERQQFEQKRREYEGAKAAYIDAGRELWEEFFTALEHARASARQNDDLAHALEQFKRKFVRREPPSTPAEKPEEK